LFELKHAEALPFLKIGGINIVPLGDRLFRILVTVENEGFLPTNVTQKAVDHRLAKTVKAKLEIQDGEILSGGATVDLGHIPGNNPALASSRGGRAAGVPNQKVAQWLVRLKGGKMQAVITAISEKAGTVTAKTNVQ
jgi:hypothetical protein